MESEQVLEEWLLRLSEPLSIPEIDKSWQLSRFTSGSRIDLVRKIYYFLGQ